MPQSWRPNHRRLWVHKEEHPVSWDDSVLAATWCEAGRGSCGHQLELCACSPGPETCKPPPTRPRGGRASLSSVQAMGPAPRQWVTQQTHSGANYSPSSGWDEDMPSLRPHACGQGEVAEYVETRFQVWCSCCAEPPLTGRWGEHRPPALASARSYCPVSMGWVVAE